MCTEACQSCVSLDRMEVCGHIQVCIEAKFGWVTLKQEVESDWRKERIVARGKAIFLPEEIHLSMSRGFHESVPNRCALAPGTLSHGHLCPFVVKQSKACGQPLWYIYWVLRM